MFFNKYVGFLITILSVIVISTGCSDDSVNGSNNNASGNKEITMATTDQVDKLSPVYAANLSDLKITEQIYEPLFDRNLDTLEIEPKLAESYENTDDLTWVIHLKKDIKFQDGTPFNAEAVKYSFEKMKQDDAVRKSLFEKIDEVKVKDENTVIIKTKEPYGALIENVLSRPNASIISPKADKAQDLNKEPVGTGPYMLDEWVRGDHLVLKKNPDYWDGEVNIDKATVKIIPDEGTKVSMLETGEVDFVDKISAKQISRIENMQDVDLLKREGTGVYYLGFNMEREPMNNLEFRKAVAKGIDLDSYIKQIDGKGTKSNSIAGAFTFGYDKSADDSGYDYDVEEAKKIMEENDWKGKKIELLVSNDDLYQDMAVFLQSQLSEIGLDVKIKTFDSATVSDLRVKNKFDLYIGSFTSGGNNALYDTLFSGSIPTPNNGRYQNDKFDKLVSTAQKTIDESKRKSLLEEANIFAIKDAPWIVMHHDVVIGAANKSVSNFKLSPAGVWHLDSMDRK
jgi:peptide/nickel transport system substrate-binding protein